MDFVEILFTEINPTPTSTLNWTGRTLSIEQVVSL